MSEDKKLEMVRSGLHAGVNKDALMTALTAAMDIAHNDRLTFLTDGEKEILKRHIRNLECAEAVEKRLNIPYNNWRK